MNARDVHNSLVEPQNTEITTYTEWICTFKKKKNFPDCTKHHIAIFEARKQPQDTYLYSWQPSKKET